MQRFLKYKEKHLSFLFLSVDYTLNVEGLYIKILTNNIGSV